MDEEIDIWGAEEPNITQPEVEEEEEGIDIWNYEEPEILNEEPKQEASDTISPLRFPSHYYSNTNDPSKKNHSEGYQIFSYKKVETEARNILMERGEYNSLLKDYATAYENVMKELHNYYSSAPNTYIADKDKFYAEINKNLIDFNNDKKLFDCYFGSVLKEVDNAIKENISNYDNTFNNPDNITELAVEYFSENRIENLTRSFDEFLSAYKESYLKALEHTINNNDNLSKIGVYANFKETAGTYSVSVNEEGNLIYSDKFYINVDINKLVKEQVCQTVANIIEQNYELDKGSISKEAVLNLMDNQSMTASFFYGTNSNAVKTILEEGRVPDSLDKEIRQWAKDENIIIPQNEFTFEMIDTEVREQLKEECSNGLLFQHYADQYIDYMDMAYKSHIENGDLVPDEFEFNRRINDDIDELQAQIRNFNSLLDTVVDETQNVMRAYLIEGAKGFNYENVSEKAFDDSFDTMRKDDILRSHEDYLKAYKNSMIKGFSSAVNSNSGLQKLHIRSVVDESDSYSINFNYFDKEATNLLNSEFKQAVGDYSVSSPYLISEIPDFIKDSYEKELLRIVETDLGLDYGTISQDEITALIEGNRYFRADTSERLIENGHIPESIKDDVKDWIREDLNKELPEDKTNTKKRSGYER